MSYVLAGEQAEGVTPIDPVEMKSSGTVKNLKYTGGKLYIRLGSATVPKTFYLSQNYPNPFNPTTRMDVGLAAPSHLTVAIYNVLGQKVRTLVDEERGAGVQTMIWNGNTDAGIQVATGLYFVRMNAGSFTQVRKIMMMK